MKHLTLALMFWLACLAGCYACSTARAPEPVVIHPDLVCMPVKTKDGSPMLFCTPVAYRGEKSGTATVPAVPEMCPIPSF